jgi:nucleoside-triphosphatase THEP1
MSEVVRNMMDPGVSKVFLQIGEECDLHSSLITLLCQCIGYLVGEKKEDEYVFKLSQVDEHVIKAVKRAFAKIGIDWQIVALNQKFPECKNMIDTDLKNHVTILHQTKSKFRFVYVRNMFSDSCGQQETAHQA